MDIEKMYYKTGVIRAVKFSTHWSPEKKHQYKIAPNGDSYAILTKEGFLSIENGYMIATGSDGEHWGIAPAIFEKTYNELPTVPKFMDEFIQSHKGMSLYEMYHCDNGITSVAQYLDEYSDTFARAVFYGYEVIE